MVDYPLNLFNFFKHYTDRLDLLQTVREQSLAMTSEDKGVVC